ncbi:hypothetical protein [Sulfitobacter sp. 1A15299]|uniref:hypothetical protein n=1 Tax=Sulfitobacter sp. 1A15299 TaxID=3368598 RepID=UPI0037492155
MMEKTADMLRVQRKLKRTSEKAMRSRKNVQVILLDLDPQGPVADWARLQELEDPIVLQAMPENLSAYLSQAEDEGADYVFLIRLLMLGARSIPRSAPLIWWSFLFAPAPSISMPWPGQLRSCSKPDAPVFLC